MKKYSQLHCYYLGNTCILAITFKKLTFVCVCNVYADAQDNEKRVSDPLGLELHVAVRHLMWVCSEPNLVLWKINKYS